MAANAVAARAKPRTSAFEAWLAIPPITWMGTERSPVLLRMMRRASRVWR